jgi:DNA-directed RNA polymerase subunit L/DNA-directed RNA polymerase alpha subunit
MAAKGSIFKKIDYVDENTVKFTLSPTRVTYANTLRRGIQTLVPCLRFRSDISETGTTTDVKIFKNTTPMSNEMLADRIGLLPLAMQKGSGWDKDSVIFKLHVKNETDEMRYVTASDFECLKSVEGEEERERIPNTKFFHPDPVTGDTCLIATLKPFIEGQEPDEIHLEAYATMGIGKEHARFNPTCQASYGYTRDEDPGRIKALWLEWLVEQKKVDVKELDKTPEKKEMLEREFRTLSINRCYLIDKEGEPYSYNFTVESTGTESISYIIASSLINLSLLCERYASLDGGDLPENVEIKPADARLKGFDFWFTDEDHTLGNLLQTWLDDNKIGKGVVTFAGYKVPHPLRNEIVLRIGVEDAKEKTARQAIAQAAKGCADIFREWLLEWTKITGIEYGDSGDMSAWEIHGQVKQTEKEEKEKQKELWKKQQELREKVMKSKK